MCGGSRPAPVPAPVTPEPQPVQPASPPTQRDAELEATNERQRRAAMASASGYDATVLTGPLGVTSSAPTYKPSLGS